MADLTAEWWSKLADLLYDPVPGQRHPPENSLLCAGYWQTKPGVYEVYDVWDKMRPCLAGKPARPIRKP